MNFLNWLKIPLGTATYGSALGLILYGIGGWLLGSVDIGTMIQSVLAGTGLAGVRRSIE